ncbi:Izumo sperm-egg fusion protein 3 [Orchesella cincta]|uniref:Izumo sperm-egg fusion protein 3 n=1 Tax=Orchesella cincta TaxID=48709 RepID=A0A1D2M550_ORCCI|nr:Izumo sperm-egg fusion protein 3 [Orchesella cincta]
MNAKNMLKFSRTLFGALLMTSAVLVDGFPSKCHLEDESKKCETRELSLGLILLCTFVVSLVLLVLFCCCFARRSKAKVPLESQLDHNNYNPASDQLFNINNIRSY